MFSGERYVYKFVCDPEALFNMAYGSSSGGNVEPPNNSLALPPRNDTTQLPNGLSTTTDTTTFVQNRSNSSYYSYPYHHISKDPSNEMYSNNLLRTPWEAIKIEIYYPKMVWFLFLFYNAQCPRLKLWLIIAINSLSK